MTLDHFKTWIEVAKNLLAIIASAIGALWLWTRFVLERGLLPPSQMDVGLRTIGLQDSAQIVELAVSVSNKGSSVLIVADLCIRLRYLSKNDKVQVFPSVEKPTFGRLEFPHAHVLNCIGAEERFVKRASKGHRQDKEVRFGPGEFLLIPYHTFVQPGIEQVYSFVTALPADATYLLANHFDTKCILLGCSSAFCASPGA
jgi:hypothetical protein